MKKLLLCLFLLMPVMLMAQAILRTKLTTNTVTGTFSQGEIPSWDVASGSWLDVGLTNAITNLNYANSLKLTNVSQTAVGAGSYLTYTMTDNDFLAGWGGSQPQVIYRDGGDKFEYGAWGYDPDSNSNGKAGQLSLRGAAAIAYGNLCGFHVNDTDLAGDNRAYVFRVKSVSGTATESGAFVWIGIRYDQSAPDYAAEVGPTYASSMVMDQYGSVYLGSLSANSDDPSLIPAWITQMRRAKVMISGSPSGSLPAFGVTNYASGTNLLAQFFANNKSDVVIDASGNVSIGSNGTFYPLSVRQQISTNAAFGIMDTNGDPRLRFGTLLGIAQYGALWGGRAAPAAATFFVASDGTNTLFNVPVNAAGAVGAFQVAGSSQWNLNSSSFSPAGNIAEDLGTSALRIREIFSQSQSLSGTGLVNMLYVTNGAVIANANATGVKPNLELPRAMVNSDMAVWQDASLLLTNSGAGHAMIQMWLNGALRGGVRADSAGNNNWHSGSGGYFVFYNGPAPTAGAFHIFTNGSASAGAAAGTTPKEKFDVWGWTRQTNGGTRYLNLAANPTFTNNQAQVYGQTNIPTTAVALKAMDGSGAEYVLTAAVTNTYSGSATLNFASQSLGGKEDLPITVTGAADGDPVDIGVPSGSTTGIAGSFTGFASNGIVFVRFISTAATQDPASGTFKALVHKIR